MSTDEYWYIRSMVRERAPELAAAVTNYYMTRDELNDTTLIHIEWAFSKDPLYVLGDHCHHTLAVVNRGTNPLTEATITEEAFNTLRVKVKLSQCL